MGELPIDHFYEINRRGAGLNAVCASTIWMLTIGAVWGDWARVAIVAGAMVAMVGFNVWINRVREQQLGFGENARTMLNLAGTMVVAQLVDWPLAVWLWPPFVALAYDRSSGWRAFAMFAVTTAIQSSLGVLHGVPWQIPAVSSMLAVHTWLISQRRMQTIRDMLVRSELQRDQLSLANAQINAALDKLQRETAARERMEVELRAAQQLESVGRIAAGVAHEINTPIQFVGDNLRFLKDGVAEILAIHQLDVTARHAENGRREQAIAAAVAAEASSDISYLTEGLPEAVSHALDGVDRVATIVSSMRQLARHGDDSVAATDINRMVNATLTVSRNEYKLVADVECELADLPLVICNGGEIGQVLLNIVVNAAHAVADATAGSSARGKIRVTTACERDDVVISISDSGTGIPPAIRDRVFDPFFTTKEVGRGTGQGLAIARALIERHHGRLTFDTEVGRGTTFHVRLPIRPAGN